MNLEDDFQWAQIERTYMIVLLMIYSFGLSPSLINKLRSPDPGDVFTFIERQRAKCRVSGILVL